MSKRLAKAPLLLLLLCATTVLALDPHWLDEFPDLDRIIADNSTGDRFEDLARQAGVVRQLREAVNILAGNRRWNNQLTPDEQAVIARYWEADKWIQSQAELVAPKGSADGGESAWTRWYLAASSYELDEDLRAATISTYFSAATLRELGYADAEHAALAARGRALTSEGFGMKPKSRWDKQTAEEKTESILFIAGMVVFMLPFLYRETRRFGISKKDPKQLRAGFRRYTLHWFSGTVANYRKSSTTTTTTVTTQHVSSGTSIRQSVTRTTYESFDLVGDTETHSVNLTDANVNFTNGLYVTAVWAIPRGKDEGLYVLMFDRTSGKTKPVPLALFQILRMRYWLMFPLSLLGAFLAAATEIFEFGGPGGLSGSGQAFFILFFGWIPLLIIFTLIASWRARRFRKRDGPKILAMIESEEKELQAAS